MTRARIAAVVLTLLIGAARADSASTVAWLQKNQIVGPVQIVSGTPTVVAGPNFFTSSDAQTQNDLYAVLLSYLQSLDSSVTQYVLTDPQSGAILGVYQNGVMTSQ